MERKLGLVKFELQTILFAGRCVYHYVINPTVNRVELCGNSACVIHSNPAGSLKTYFIFFYLLSILLPSLSHSSTHKLLFEGLSFHLEEWEFVLYMWLTILKLTTTNLPTVHYYSSMLQTRKRRKKHCSKLRQWVFLRTDIANVLVFISIWTTALEYC